MGEARRKAGAGTGGVLIMDSTSASKALIQAANSGDLPSLEAALAAGAWVDWEDDENNTALIHPHDELECLMALMAAGAYVDAQGRKGRSALMLASDKGDLACVEALLAAGANEWLEDEAGRTWEAYATGSVGDWLDQLAREEEAERLDQTLPEGPKEESERGRF